MFQISPALRFEIRDSIAAAAFIRDDGTEVQRGLPAFVHQRTYALTFGVVFLVGVGFGFYHFQINLVLRKVFVLFQKTDNIAGILSQGGIAGVNVRRKIKPDKQRFFVVLQPVYGFF